MEQVDVVIADNDRVTLRVGDVFLKIDADQIGADVESRRCRFGHGGRFDVCLGSTLVENGYGAPAE